MKILIEQKVKLSKLVYQLYAYCILPCIICMQPHWTVFWSKTDRETAQETQEPSVFFRILNSSSSGGSEVDTFCPDSGKTKSMIIYTSNTEAVKAADLVFLDIATKFTGTRFSWQKDNTYLPDSKTPWFWKIFDRWIDSHPSELALRWPFFPYSWRLPSDWVV